MTIKSKEMQNSHFSTSLYIYSNLKFCVNKDVNKAKCQIKQEQCNNHTTLFFKSLPLIKKLQVNSFVYAFSGAISYIRQWPLFGGKRKIITLYPLSVL